MTNPKDVPREAWACKENNYHAEALTKELIEDAFIGLRKENTKLKAQNKILAEQFEAQIHKVTLELNDAHVESDRLYAVNYELQMQMNAMESENANLKLTLSGKTFSCKVESKDV